MSTMRDYKKILQDMIVSRMKADRMPPELIQVFLNRLEATPTREEIDRARHQLFKAVLETSQKHL